MAEEITTEEGTKKSALQNLGVGAWIGIAVATCVIGILIGKFMLGGSGAALNKTSLTENELNTVVGTIRRVVQANPSLHARSSR